MRNPIHGSTLLVLLSLLLMRVAPAEALTPVNPAGGCPQTLSAPGEYVLTGDLACSGTVSGIVITSANVTFHLAGHTISNAACDLTVGFGGIFVMNNVSGVEIDGGTISGFNDGIDLNASSSQVRGMKIKNACAFGVAVSGQGNRIDKNVVTGSQLDGIGLGSANGTVVTYNDISSNRRVGVDISNFSNGNVVYSNIIHDNGVSEGYGVAVFNGLFNIVFDNVLSNNFIGVGLQSPANLAQANTVSGSRNTGIAISTDGAPSAVRLNTVLGSVIVDMSDGSPTCGANQWQNNTFETDQAAGIPDGGPAAGCIR